VGVNNGCSVNTTWHAGEALAQNRILGVHIVSCKTNWVTIRLAGLLIQGNRKLHGIVCARPHVLKSGIRRIVAELINRNGEILAMSDNPAATEATRRNHASEMGYITAKATQIVPARDGCNQMRNKTRNRRSGNSNWNESRASKLEKKLTNRSLEYEFHKE
jgi:hypothetical protein